MYIAEVAPARMRGKLVAINQLTVVVGILMAQFINWFLVRKLPAGATDEFIRNSWFGQQGWRWMFGLTAAPALLFFAGMMVIPESPRWLLKKGKTELGAEHFEADWRRKLCPGRNGGNSVNISRRNKRKHAIERTLRTENVQGPHTWRHARCISAMVRHQRHI